MCGAGVMGGGRLARGDRASRPVTTISGQPLSSRTLNGEEEGESEHRGVDSFGVAAKDGGRLARPGFLFGWALGVSEVTIPREDTV